MGFNGKLRVWDSYAAAASITPGVMGSMDHVLLNNQRLWNGMVGDSPLTQFFRRWYSNSRAGRGVELVQLMTYSTPQRLEC